MLWHKLVRENLLLLVLAVVLSGCFRSETALISAEEADFPFSTITYTDPGGQEITLNRVGDLYIDPDEGEESAVRIKALDENTYVGQIAVSEDSGQAFLYGLIRLTDDRKGFYFAHSVADEQAKAAAREGKFGFRLCDGDTVCIDSLDGFVEFAASASDTGPAANIFTIRNLK